MMVLRRTQEFIKKHTSGNLIMAEVGVFQGGNALRLLTLNVKQLFLIDPYIAYKQYEQNDYAYNQEQMDEALKIMRDRIRPHLDKTTIILQKSVIAADLFPERFFDFVYIDGNHSYEMALADMAVWYSKIRIGGYLAGHDFVTAAVARACWEFAALKNIELTYWVDPKDYKPKEHQTATIDGDKDWIMQVK